MSKPYQQVRSDFEVRRSLARDDPNMQLVAGFLGLNLCWGFEPLEESWQQAAGALEALADRYVLNPDEIIVILNEIEDELAVEEEIVHGR
ncbi:MAG: hypothetical protein JWN38_840 [Candidatus Saccharibacteria bacterium]|nr:hypothetical protein [Candidatus Saccharibacteria bacterium]